MEEKNELNDIILNKGGANSNNKKIILAVATLGVILIVVVMLMNSLTSNGTDNLPQAVLPPEPKIKPVAQTQDEPLFEEVEVVEEETNSNNLDEIAKRLKQESLAKEAPKPIAKKPEPKPIVKKETPKPVVAKKQETPKAKTTASVLYYIQVGSFSKYEPDKKFLKSITDSGYSFKYHKVTRNSKVLNKVLVGPFNSEKEARTALSVVRKTVEPGAFLTKL